MTTTQDKADTGRDTRALSLEVAAIARRLKEIEVAFACARYAADDRDRLTQAMAELSMAALTVQYAGYACERAAFGRLLDLAERTNA